MNGSQEAPLGDEPRDALFALSQDRMIAGVASGMADVLRVPSIYVRAAFCALTLLWGLGLMLYVILWAVSAGGGARNPSPLITRMPSSESQLMRTGGLGIAFGGFLVTFRAALPWPGDRLVWPAVATIAGMAVLADRSDTDPRAVAANLFDPSGRWVRTRALGGGALLLGGAAMLFSTQLDKVALAAVITALGAVLVFGPWLRRLASALSEERRERIRQEERADMAAHLHDSVLQTLALIQRSDDHQKIVTLARAQERELRDWLFENKPGDDAMGFAAALKGVAAKIEGDFSIPIEVVTVGDLELDDRIQPVVLAAGEAILNAVKHSGAERVAVYSEIAAGKIDVWISDQGKGFDVANIGEDRHGISESIRGRMRRQDGTAEISSRTGEGTEVHLHLPNKERSS